MVGCGSDADMTQPHEALKAGGRVEIFRINDNLNEWGYEEDRDRPDEARAARILDKAGRIVAQVPVDASQIPELLKLGAVEV